MFDYLKAALAHLTDTEKIWATCGGVIGYISGLTLINIPVFTIEFFGKFIGALILAFGGAASGVAGKKTMTTVFDWWGKRKKKRK